MNHRINRFWYFFLVGILFLSCKKDNRVELFTIPDHVDFTIAPGLNTFDTHFYSLSPKTSPFESLLANSGHTHAEVISIEAKEAYLSSIFHDVNLNFIDKISVWIFDPFNPNDRIEFFYLEQIPYKNKTSIQLFPGIADISDWVDREFYGIEVRLNFREVTPSSTDMRLEFSFRVLGE
jgi:hypothetical protein